MKVYIHGENNKAVYDENHNQRYVDVIPCPKCKEYRWSNNEKLAVQRAVELIYLLVDFKSNLSYKATGCVSSSDWRYIFALGALITPMPELIEYHNYQIGLLQGVLQLAAFTATTDVDMKYLISAYRVIRNLICHIHNDHREEKIVPPDDFSNGDSPKLQLLPIAPSDYFRPKYPDWVGLEELFYLLPDIRGESHEKIFAYCKKELDQVEAGCVQKACDEEREKESGNKSVT